MSMRKKLVYFGFTIYEAELYVMLLDHGLLTASELSKQSNVPQGRIYNVLGSLQKKGFCNIRLGTVKKYEAINPKIAFIDLIQQQKNSVEELENLQSDLETTFNEKNQSSSTEFIQVLTSKQGQIEKFDDLIRHSSKNLNSFNKKPYGTGFDRESEAIKEDSRPLIHAIKRGVSVKAIFEAESGKDILPFLDMISYYQSIGEEVRICKKLPLKMLLSDDDIAMISLQNNNKINFKLTSIVVDHSDLINAMNELFELYWGYGITIEDFIKINK